jgi:NAD(P)-dependent dehydrogenase (short-subunit alcohol dehydrogenase family)
MTLRVALVTGGSSGIGQATALELAGLGFTVYAGARRLDRMEGLSAQGVRSLSLDLTDDSSVVDAVARIEREAGRLDVLVNNAGYGSFGAVEDLPLAEGRRQFDVNVFGAMRLIQLVLPLMRRQGAGRIVNVTSVGGKIYSPFGAWYHGTKFALEGMSDALRIELKKFGIDVVVIEPGAVRTEWGTIAADQLIEVSGRGAYAADARKFAETTLAGTAGDSASDPAVVAKAIATAVTARRPKTRYAVGYMAKPILTLRRLLPDKSFDRLMARSSQ